MGEELTEHIAAIERRLDEIDARNARVSLDKRWETSATRKISILITTYLAMCILLTTLGHGDPLLHAVVPTLGFFLSTLSLPIIRERWKTRIDSASKSEHQT